MKPNTLCSSSKSTRTASTFTGTDLPSAATRTVSTEASFSFLTTAHPGRPRCWQHTRGSLSVHTDSPSVMARGDFPTNAEKAGLTSVTLPD